LAEKRPLSDF